MSYPVHPNNITAFCCIERHQSTNVAHPVQPIFQTSSSGSASNEVSFALNLGSLRTPELLASSIWAPAVGPTQAQYERTARSFRILLCGVRTSRGARDVLRKCAVPPTRSTSRRAVRERSRAKRIKGHDHEERAAKRVKRDEVREAGSTSAGAPRYGSACPAALCDWAKRVKRMHHHEGGDGDMVMELACTDDFDE